MTSKATQAARERDVERLQHIIGDAPLVAFYSELYGFVIKRPTGYVMVAGRFQVVGAYLRGYQDGRRSQVEAQPSEPHQVTP